MSIYWSVELIAPLFLTSVLDGFEWYPLVRKLCGPRSRSGSFWEERNLTPAGNWTSAVQPIALRCTDWAILAPAENNRLFYFIGLLDEEREKDICSSLRTQIHNVLIGLIYLIEPRNVCSISLWIWTICYSGLTFKVQMDTICARVLYCNFHSVWRRSWQGWWQF